MPTTMHHQVLIIGGGNAGIAVAARLRRAGVDDVGLIEPSTKHYYQPLWTLVGGGLAPVKASVRPQASVMPQGVAWIRDRAEQIDPENRTVTTAAGARISYGYLVVAPGIQLNWDAVPGMADALRTPAVSSNYGYDLAPGTWDGIRALRSGTAVFSMPSGLIKCAGAPQKIAYLAADHWRREGVLKDIRMVLVLPTPGMFGVPEFARELEKVVARYDIEVLFQSEVVEIDGQGKQVVVADNAAGTKQSIAFDFMHTVPPQSAPDWLRATPLPDPASPGGFVEVDKHTLRHTRFPEIFALGDAGSTPNSKTGAAIRKQAPVLVENLRAVLAGADPTARYSGYASCPLTTGRDKLLLAEFDYSMRPAPTFTFVDTLRERTDFGLLKRRGLPWMYWNLLLRGLA